jgi:hypothetical protein
VLYEQAQRATDTIPAAALLTLERGGHFALACNPAARPQVRAFLRQHAPLGEPPEARGLTMRAIAADEAWRGTDEQPR